MARNKNVPISGPLNPENDLYFAESLGHKDFITSVGWLDKFKKRHSIIQKLMSGEIADINEHACEDWKNNILPDLIRPYYEKYIFNANETAFFFKCLPDKTLTFNNEKCLWGRHFKERFTLMIGSTCVVLKNWNHWSLGSQKTAIFQRENVFACNSFKPLPLLSLYLYFYSKSLFI